MEIVKFTQENKNTEKNSTVDNNIFRLGAPDIKRTNEFFMDPTGNLIGVSNGRLKTNEWKWLRKLGYSSNEERIKYQNENPELYKAMNGVKYGITKESERAIRVLKQRFKSACDEKISNAYEVLQKNEWQSASKMNKLCKDIETFENDFVALKKLGYFEEDQKLYIKEIKELKEYLNIKKTNYSKYENANQYNERVIWQKKYSSKTWQELDEAEKKLKKSGSSKELEYVKGLREGFQNANTYNTYISFINDSETEIAKKFCERYRTLSDYNKFINGLAETYDSVKEELKKINYKGKYYRHEDELEVAVAENIKENKRYRDLSNSIENLRIDEKYGSLDQLELENTILEELNERNFANGKIKSMVETAMDDDDYLKLRKTGENKIKKDKYMTDTEYEIACYYVAKDKTLYKKYLEELDDELKRRKMKEIATNFSEFADMFPNIASAVSVITNLSSAFETVVDTGKFIATGDLDYNTSAIATSAIRGTVASKKDIKIGNFDAYDMAYGIRMSYLDSLAAIGLSKFVTKSEKFGGIIIGLSAAGNATNSALNRGLSDGYAFANGVAAGVFETVFETWSLGKFSECAKNINYLDIKSLTKFLGKNMWNSALEETLTEIANISYDRLVNGKFSEYEYAIRNYIKSGLTESEAKHKVALETAGQVAESAVGGALSSFVFLANDVSKKKVINNIDYNVQNIITPLKTLDYYDSNYDSAIDLNNKESKSLLLRTEQQLSDSLRLYDDFNNTNEGVISTLSNAQENYSNTQYNFKNISQTTYENQLSAIESGEQSGSNLLHIEVQNEQLQNAGLSSAEFVMTQADYKNSSNNVPYEFFKNLPQYISEPVMVIDNGNRAIIITDYSMRDFSNNNSFVAVEIEKNRQVGNNILNVVRNVYPLDNFERQITEAVDSGKVIVANKSKTNKMLTDIGIKSDKVLRILKYASEDIRQGKQHLGNKPTLKNGNIVNVLTGNEIDGNTYRILQRLENGETVTADEVSNIKEVLEGSKIVEAMREKFIAENPQFAYMTKKDVGTYLLNSDERIELRNNIIEERLREGSFSGIDKNGNDEYNGVVEKSKRLDIVIGLPAAGKSSAIVNTLSEFYQSAVIDSDIIKSRLPEFNGGWGAMLVHEESSQINLKLLEKIMKTNANIVLPIVGSKISSVEKYIIPATKLGYNINVHLNELPNGKAVGRMLKRYFGTGRFIDPYCIIEYANKPTEVYEQIKKRDDISGYSRWSNDVEYGQRPKLIEISENNKSYGIYNETGIMQSQSGEITSTENRSDINGYSEERNDTERELAGVRGRSELHVLHDGESGQSSRKILGRLDKTSKRAGEIDSVENRSDINGYSEERNDTERELAGVRGRSELHVLHDGENGQNNRENVEGNDSKTQSRERQSSEITSTENRSDINGYSEEKNDTERELAGVRGRSELHVLHDGESGEIGRTETGRVYKTFERAGEIETTEGASLTDGVFFDLNTTNAVTKPIESYPAEKQDMIKSYLNSVDENLVDLVERVKKGTNKFERVYISDVNAREANDIKNLLDIDVEGYTHNINTGGVKHILKRHGVVGNHDNSMSNVNDIARMGWVIENYDNIEVLQEKSEISTSSEFADKNNKPAIQIRYSKKINGTYDLVEAAFENNYNKLWVQSAYLKKNESVTRAPDASKKTPEVTSETEHASPLSSDSVSRNKVNVNQEYNKKSESVTQVHTASKDNLPYGHARSAHASPLSRDNVSRNDKNVNNKKTDEKIFSIFTKNRDVSKVLSQEEVIKTREFADAFGLNVKFEDLRNTVSGNTKMKSPDGYIDKSGNIYINIYAENPYRSVLVHETVHFSQNTPEYKRYSELVRNTETYRNWLYEVTGESDLQKAEFKFKEQLTEINPNVKSNDSLQAMNELIAYFTAENLFTDNGENVMNAALEMKPKQRNAFVRFVNKIIDYIRGKLSKLKWFKNTFAGKEISVLEKSFKSMVLESSEEYRKGNYKGETEYCFVLCKDEEKIKAAEQMKKENKSYADIYKEHQLIKDVYGNWLFELNIKSFKFFADGNAKTESHYFNNKLKWKNSEVIAKLEDFVSCKELFEYYPQLRETDVIIHDAAIRNGIAYDFSKKTINISKSILDDFKENKNKDIKSQLLGTIQEIIQHIEKRRSKITFWDWQRFALDDKTPYDETLGRKLTAEEGYQNTYDNYEVKTVANRQELRDNILSQNFSYEKLKNSEIYMPKLDKSIIFDENNEPVWADEYNNAKNSDKIENENVFSKKQINSDNTNELFKDNKNTSEIKKFLLNKRIHLKNDLLNVLDIRAGSDDMISNVADNAKEAFEIFNKDFMKKLSQMQLNDYDTVGRKLDENIIKEFADTIFKNESGQIISLYTLKGNGIGGFKPLHLGMKAGTLESVKEEYLKYNEEHIQSFKPVVQEIFVNMKNPIMVNFSPYEISIKDFNIKLVESGALRYKDIHRGIFNEKKANKKVKYGGYIIEKLTEYIKNAGYDGIFYYNNSTDPGSMEVIVLDESQVKLVAENGILKENNGISQDYIDFDFIEENAENIDNKNNMRLLLTELNYSNKKIYHPIPDDKISAGNSAFFENTYKNTSRSEKELIRNLEGKSQIKLSGKDSSGREIDKKTERQCADTVFKDEKGNLISFFTNSRGNIFTDFGISKPFSTLGTLINDWLIYKEKFPMCFNLIVREYYINSVNTLVLKLDKWNAKKAATQLLDKGIITEKFYYNLFDDVYKRKSEKMKSKKLVDQIKMKGFNSIVFVGKNGEYKISVFDENQIFHVADNGILKNRDNSVVENNRKFDNTKTKRVIIDSKAQKNIDVDNVREKINSTTDNTNKLKLLTNALMCNNSSAINYSNEITAGNSGLLESGNPNAFYSRAIMNFIVNNRNPKNNIADIDTAGKALSEYQKELLKSTVFKDKQGRPLSLYAYNNLQSTGFKMKKGIWYKVGTLASAYGNMILEFKNHPQGSKGTIEEYYVISENPYNVMFEPETLTPAILAKYMYNELLITQKQYHTVLSYGGVKKLGINSAAAHYLINILKNKGYDSITFMNRRFDPGSISVIVFERNQLIPTAIDGLPIENKNITLADLFNESAFFIEKDEKSQ